MIAEAVAMAANRAFDTGRSVRIKLDTIRLGTDRWQQYEVKIRRCTETRDGQLRPGGRYGPESDPRDGTGEEEDSLRAASGRDQAGVRGGNDN